MEAGELALDRRQQLWLQGHQNISCFKSVRTFSDKKVVTSEKRRIDQMFCEQEKSVTLTKNTIGWSEDSYRGAAAWEIHADEARNTICLRQEILCCSL